MSGLFGILETDGRPACREDLQRMLGAMAAWGPHGQGLQVSGGTGFGHLKLLATPEARREALPRRDPGAGLLFTASARLDDRDELADALGLQDRSAWPDTSLVLAAWQRWGLDALPRLRGDWAFALWDERDRSLVLARDPYGQTSLYHCALPGRIAFASSQKALLALPDLPRDPDDLRLAQVLTAWPGDGVATAYTAIRRLPPAHVLVWRDGQASIRRYWAMEDAPAVRLGSDGDYVEALVELLTRAVRARLRRVGAVGSTLSGGLDSSTITALAARELGGEPLTALTAVPLFSPDGARPGRFGDEWPLAHALARDWPGIVHVPVTAADVSPLEGIRRQLRVHDEPGHAASNQYWLASLLETARELGLGVLLTGQGGNAGLSWPGRPDRPWQYLWAGEPGRALRDLMAWKAEHRRSWLGALRSQVLRPLLAPALALLRPAREPWRAYSAIHPGFARELDLPRRMREAGHDPRFAGRRTPLVERCAVLQPGRSILGALWCEAGAAHGLEIRDPTADTRLLAFCLGCPDDQYSRQGQDRWLVRRATEGLLPGEIRWNRARGLQAADLTHRLQRELPAVREWLRELEASPACTRRLDLARLGAVAEALASGAGPALRVQASALLCRGFGVGRFLLG